MKGLAPKTEAIFEEVSTLQCIQDFVLVGGTCIALQLDHRLSEDIDFCKWIDQTNVQNGIEIKKIEKELISKFGKVETNYLSFDQVDFYVQNVKITFFNESGYNVPPFEPIHYLGNVNGAQLSLIASMKVKTMFQRTKFRDYYDLFVLLKEGAVTSKELLTGAINYDAKLTAQMIQNRLCRWQNIDSELAFTQLRPKYEVTVRQIGEYFQKLFG